MTGRIGFRASVPRPAQDIVLSGLWILVSGHGYGPMVMMGCRKEEGDIRNTTVSSLQGIMTPLYHTEVKSVAIRGDLWKNDVQSSKDDLNSFWERLNGSAAQAAVGYAERRHFDVWKTPKETKERSY